MIRVSTLQIYIHRKTLERDIRKIRTHEGVVIGHRTFVLAACLRFASCGRILFTDVVFFVALLDFYRHMAIILGGGECGGVATLEVRVRFKQDSFTGGV